MYRTIIVPLDGSALSERAIPVATRLARATNGQVVLVRSAWVHHVTEFDDPTREIAALEEAERYLLEVRSHLDNEDVVVDTAVPFAPPAEGILVEAELREADLIVMSSHGRSGLGRWVFGSVAEEVLHKSKIPVMLVRTWETRRVVATEPEPSQALVPLDGSVFAEAAIPYATELAKLLNGSVVLVRVVPMPVVWASPLAGQPYPTMEIINEEEAEARAYLEEVATRVRQEGAHAQTILRVDAVARAIVEESHLPGVAFVVMATHGRTGLNQALFGSTALEVMHRGTPPLLLVRPTGLVSPEQEATDLLEGLPAL